jgi:Holliday junction resolvase RusA-like endonuclease
MLPVLRSEETMAVMSFGFTVPGSPPSVNHMYQQVERRSPTGNYRSVKKADAVADYQGLAAMVVRLARPKNWLNNYTEGEYIRVCYRFTLTRHADCDNLMKALNDSIAGALQVDDKWFLPCVTSKTVNAKAEAQVEVTIGPDEAHPHA